MPAALPHPATVAVPATEIIGSAIPVETVIVVETAVSPVAIIVSVVDVKMACDRRALREKTRRDRRITGLRPSGMGHCKKSTHRGQKRGYRKQLGHDFPLLGDTTNGNTQIFRDGNAEVSATECMRFRPRRILPRRRDSARPSLGQRATLPRDVRRSNSRRRQQIGRAHV